MFPPPRSRLKSGETRTPATGKHSGTDNREGRADRRLCSGVKGPPWRGSLAPRTDFMLQGTSEPQAPPPPGRRRGPGSRPVNLAGTAKESDGRGMGGGGLRRRRLPGPLPARDSCRRPHGAPRGSRRGPCATRVAAGAVGSRDPAAAPVRAARASGHRRRERGAHVGPETHARGPRHRGKVNTNFAGGEGPAGVAPTPPGPPRGRAAGLRGRRGAEPPRARENAPLET